MKWQSVREEEALQRWWWKELFMSYPLSDNKIIKLNTNKNNIG